MRIEGVYIFYIFFNLQLEFRSYIALQCYFCRIFSSFLSQVWRTENTQTFDFNFLIVDSDSRTVARTLVFIKCMLKLWESASVSKGSDKFQSVCIYIKKINRWICLPSSIIITCLYKNIHIGCRHKTVSKI